MSIKIRIALSFLFLLISIAVLAALSFSNSIEEAEFIASHEAQSLAKSIGVEIQTHLLKRGANINNEGKFLQGRIQYYKRIHNRDIVIVNSRQKILADAIPEEIGTIFNHDKNDEVGKTLVDYQIRSFKETSKAYPKGILSLAVPIHDSSHRTIGAVIMEYTPIYNEVLARVETNIERFMLYYVTALLIIVLVGQQLYKSISRPLALFENALDKMAGGEQKIRVEYSANDEFNKLAESFNAMASEKERALKRIEKSLKEKNILLQEIHHRVRNNMAVIISLLRLQSRYIDNKEIQDILLDSQNRIKSMALIHEKLYQTKDFLNLDVEDYFRSLIKNLIISYKIREGNIRLNISVEKVSIEISTLITLGLILNELVSNSLKYAFDNCDQPMIHIELKREKQEMILLNIADNGSGLPQGLDIENINSLGLRLVKSLVEQLSGNLNMSKNNGAHFSISYPDRKQGLNNDG